LQIDGMMSYFGPDAIWDMSSMGLGVYEGVTAVRRFFEDWRGAYEEHATEPEEIVEASEGMTFAVFLQKGRPVGSVGQVTIHYAAVVLWTRGLVKRVTIYTDIDEARAAAERLAEERR
jgi:ketosteroid isomerase-like protein